MWDVPPKRVTLSANGADDATSYKWYLDGVLKATTTESHYALPIKGNVNCGNFYYFGVRAVGACGTSDETYIGDYMPPCDFGFRISPNPAASIIRIEKIETENLNTSDATIISEIEIFDKTGMLKLRKQPGGRKAIATISVSGLANDVYTLRIFDGKKWQTTKIIVQH